jgi:hypothetical protein
MSIWWPVVTQPALQEPIDQPYGVRDCGFRDPAGNHVRIGTPLPLPS